MMRLIPKLPKPQSKAGRAGMIAGKVIGGLIALDLVATLVTVAVGAQFLKR